MYWLLMSRKIKDIKTYKRPVIRITVLNKCLKLKVVKFKKWQVILMTFNWPILSIKLMSPVLSGGATLC
jgi:hypothetical protein